MTEAHQRRSGRGVWVLGAIAAALGLLLWIGLRPADSRSRDDSAEDAEASTGVASDDADVDDHAVAHARGQVWLEVPVGGAVGLPELGDDGVADDGVADDGVADDGVAEDGVADDGVAEDGVADDGVAEDGVAEDGVADDGVSDAGDAEAFVPPPVTLIAPGAGACSVIAWQDGERVSDETPCEPDGSFDVALAPGRFGRTAFEVLVPGRLRAVLEVQMPHGGLGRLPAVALGVAQTISGHVIDARGEPVADVAITAMPWPNLDEPEPWRASSEADGAFSMDTLPPGPVSLRVAAPGFAPAIVEAIAPQSDVIITLEALIDLSGRVVGDPAVLARTHVRLEGSAVWPAIEAAVDPENGEFVFESIPDGVYALEAVAPAETEDQVEFASFPLENVTPDLSVALALGPAARVIVDVVDPDGAPVPDARVTLSNATVGLLARVATTDVQGHVSVGPVVPGPYVLRGEADGFLAAEPLAVTLASTGDPPTGDPPAHYRVVLQRPGAIAGLVVDEHDHPVADATVQLQAEHLHTTGEGQARARMFAAALTQVGSLGVTVGPVPPIPTVAGMSDETLDSVRTDAEGRFSIPLLSPGRYRLAAHHGHFAHSEDLMVTVGPDHTRAGVRLVLRTGHALTGRVVDSNDRPLPGARIAAADGTVAVADARGVYALGRRRGRQHLVVRHQGFAPQARTVMVSGPTDLRWVLKEANGIVEGRVEGQNGEVLADARVTVRPVDGLAPTRVGWTDARGLYRFEGVPPGRVEIEVEHQRYAANETTATVDDSGTGKPDPVDLVMAAGWSLQVRVRAAGSRSAIVGARVVAGTRSATTDSSGLATLDNLVGASLTVTVQAAEYGTQSLRISAPAAGEATVDVELSDGGGLSGRVTDYRAEVVAGAKVVVAAVDGSDERTTHTDADGQWMLQGLPEGDYEVRAVPTSARREELAPDAQSTDVRRGHVTRGVDLRFDRR